ncbi:hypothetical protein KPL44_23710 [Clostridium sp. DSM 17811]|uniref:hypothetical protein n=1 Tax=Clostridium sp. DSM 17811 TaxID=2843317 RepID=UPI001C0C3E1F|nr:hypothetical protein [Clostridium sp. DSM 17811]MBU3102249.1 hypothetical protein [Clostridium sp. DSM 17811]
MKRNIISTTLIALLLAGTTSFSTSAVVPSATLASIVNGSVIINTHVFTLEYANTSSNRSEIVDALIKGNEIYVKDFDGNWIDNLTGVKVDVSIITGEYTFPVIVNPPVIVTPVVVDPSTYKASLTSKYNAAVAAVQTNIYRTILLPCDDNTGRMDNSQLIFLYKILQNMNNDFINHSQLILEDYNTAASILDSMTEAVTTDNVAYYISDYTRRPQATTLHQELNSDVTNEVGIANTFEDLHKVKISMLINKADLPVATLATVQPKQFITLNNKVYVQLNNLFCLDKNLTIPVINNTYTVPVVDGRSILTDFDFPYKSTTPFTDPAIDTTVVKSLTPGNYSIKPMRDITTLVQSVIVDRIN